MNNLRRVLTHTDTEGSHGYCYSGSLLDAILDATKLDMGGSLCTTTSKDVGELSDNERSESVVDRRSEKSCAEVAGSFPAGGSTNFFR
jgi:hypothetical protein